MSRFSPFRGLGVLVVPLFASSDAKPRRAPIRWRRRRRRSTDIAAASQPPTVVVASANRRPDRDGALRAIEQQQPRFLRQSTARSRARATSTYFFEVSATPDFSQMAAIVTAPANGTGNTLMSLGSLAYGGTLLLARQGHRRQHRIGLLEHADFHAAERAVCRARLLRSGGVDRIRVMVDRSMAQRTSSLSSTKRRSRRYPTPACARCGATLSRAAPISRTAGAATCGRGCSCRCPAARSPTGPMFPQCSYSRTVDLGSYGRGVASGSRGSELGAVPGVKP